MKKTIYPIAIVSMAFMFAGCSDDDGPNGNAFDSYHRIDLSSAEKTVAERYNEFSVEMLLSQMKTYEAGGEALLPSLDIIATLSALANGDNGATRDAILLKITGSHDAAVLQTVNSLNNKLFSEMPRMQGGDCYRNGARLLVPGDAKLKDPFISALTQLNGSSQDMWTITNSKSDIDSWCRYVTSDRIQTVPAQSAGNTFSAYVASGLTLPWGDEVENVMLKKGEFHSLTGSANRTVDMLWLDCDEVKYAESQGLTAVRIPLGNGNFTFTGICIEGYAGLKELTYADIKNLRYKETDMQLTLPAVKCAYARDIMPLLKSERIGQLFDASQGLNAVCDKTVVLNQFVIAATAALDKQGVAASGVAGAETRSSRTAVVVTFDHTFIYFIEEASTGVILSAGIYD